MLSTSSDLMQGGAASATVLCAAEPVVKEAQQAAPRFSTSHPLAPCSSAKSAAAESAYWAGQTARRAEARASTKDLALDKLDQLAKREGQVGGEGWDPWGAAGFRTEGGIVGQSPSWAAEGTRDAGPWESWKAPALRSWLVGG